MNLLNNHEKQRKGEWAIFLITKLQLLSAWITDRIDKVSKAKWMFGLPTKLNL